MTSLRILVASPTISSATRVSQMLGQFADFALLQPAQTLQELMHRAERDRANLALISTRLTNLPEFEVVASMLQAQDVRWIAIRGSSPQDSAGQASTRHGSDLFEVSAGVAPDILAQQIRSVCRNVRTPLQDRTVTDARPSKAFKKFILLGASTGGVDSLIQVLEQFPVDAPPTVIVQHTGGAYLAGLSKLFDRRTACRVVAADKTSYLERGQILLAAADNGHLVFGRSPQLRCDISEAPPVSGHRPSVDAMFQSAVPFAKQAVAVLMTGMGRDGAAGLKALKDAGALTAAQDKATSVVYGMPRVAAEMGAADYILPLNKIASFVLSNAS